MNQLKLIWLTIAVYSLFRFGFEFYLHTSYDSIIKNKTFNLTPIKTENFNNDEWLAFYKTLYLRRMGVFYFYNESSVSILAFSKQNKTYGLRCLFTIENQKQETMEILSRKAEFKKLHVSLDQLYVSFVIECSLKKQLINRPYNVKIKVHIVDYHTHYKSNEPLNVQVMFNNTPSHKKGEFLLCSSHLFISLDQYSDLKKWIDFNLHIGFQKIILYNHSLPIEYGKLFDSYNGSVELRNYRYIPHMFLGKFENETEDAYVRNLTNSQVNWPHQRICLNECYLSNRHLYNKIAVFDIDELIIPRQIFQLKHDLKKPLNCKFNGSKETALQLYFKELSKWKSFRNAASLRFPYLSALDSDFTKGLLRGLDQLKTNPMFNIKIENYYQGNTSLLWLNSEPIQLRKHFQISVDTRVKLSHAKYLVEVYGHFRRMYNLTNLVDRSRFSRLFVIGTRQWDIDNGKSIHFTNRVKYIFQHHALFVDFVRVPTRFGYTTHFRDRIKVLPIVPHVRRSDTRTFFVNIEKIHFDFNYLCYLFK